jgi:hypothetical protein
MSKYSCSVWQGIRRSFLDGRNDNGWEEIKTQVNQKQSYIKGKSVQNKQEYQTFPADYNISNCKAKQKDWDFQY